MAVRKPKDETTVVTMEEVAPVITTEETSTENIVFNEEPETKVAPERSVKVVLNSNHSCTIGGAHYHFEKGKQYNVPSSVKSILMQAGLLMPL